MTCTAHETIASHRKSRMLTSALGAPEMPDAEELRCWFERIDKISPQEQPPVEMDNVVELTVKSLGFSSTGASRLAA